MRQTPRMAPATQSARDASPFAEPRRARTARLGRIARRQPSLARYRYVTAGNGAAGGTAVCAPWGKTHPSPVRGGSNLRWIMSDDNRTVIVDRGGGGSGAAIVAILVILVLVVAGWYFLAGPGAGGTTTQDTRTDINVNLPSIQAPQAS